MNTTFFRDVLRPKILQATAREFAAARKPAKAIAGPRLFDLGRPFTAIKLLTPKDTHAIAARYLSADSHGHYPGDAHKLFALSVREFGRRTGLKRQRARGGFAWVVEVPKRPAVIRDTAM
jgi:hypothetical protein